MSVYSAGLLKSTVTVKAGELHFDTGEGSSLLSTGGITAEGSSRIVGTGSVSSLTLKSGTSLTPRSLLLEETFGGIFPGKVKSSAVMNFNTGSTLNIIINGTGANDYSTLEPKLLTMNGTVKVTLMDGYTPKAGDAFTLWTVANTFSGTPVFELPELPEGLYWKTTDVAAKTGVLLISDDPSQGIGRMTASTPVTCEVFTLSGVSMGTFSSLKGEAADVARTQSLPVGTYILKMHSGLRTETTKVVIR